MKRRTIPLPALSRLGLTDCWIRIFILFFTLSAAAQQAVTVTRGELTKRIWVASSSYTLDHNQDDATLVVLGDLLEAAGVDMNSVLLQLNAPSGSAQSLTKRKAPRVGVAMSNAATQTTLTKDQAEKIVAAIQGILANNQTPAVGYLTREEKVNALFDFVDKAAGGLPSDIGPGVQAANVLMKTAVQAMDRAFASQADQQGQVQFSDQPLPLMAQEAQLQQSVLEQIYDLSQGNPDIAVTINDLLSRNLSAPIDTDIPTILQDNPDFAATPIVQYLQQNGLSNQQLTLDLGSLESTFTQSLSDLQSGVFDQALPLIQNINQNELMAYTALEDYIAQANDRANNEAEAARQQQLQKLQIDASKEGVYLLSTFAGLLNPQLGHDMSVVGNAAIQVNQAISSYTLPAAAVDTSSVLSNFTGDTLGAVIFSGNLVGAAMQVASIFQNNPSPDQIILQQLQQISAQITNLQNNMNQRFDRVDGKLSELCGQVATILGTLNQIGTQISQIQTQLYELQTQVGRLESEIHTWLAESDRLPLQETINNVIGYQTRTGQRLSFPDYNSAESQLYTFAQFFCSSNTLAGDDYTPGSTPFAELTQTAQGSAQITGVPYSDKINWLLGFVSQALGFQVPMPSRLCNPNDHAFSANAYAELVRQNADYASQEPGATARILNIISVGQQLQSALNALANRALFLDPSHGLTAYYRQMRDNLRQSIKTFESTFISSNTCGSGTFSNCIPTNVDLWADPNSTMTYRPSIGGLNGCDGLHNLSLTVPGNDIYYAVPAALLDADRRAGSQIGLCLSLTWPDGPPDGGSLAKRIEETIIVTFRGVEVLSMSVIPDVGYCCFENDPWWWITSGGSANEWDDAGIVIRSWFENHSDISLAVSDWAQQLYQTLQAKRADFYSQVQAAFIQGGQVQSAADDLSGAKLLLDAIMALGLPRSLEGDDYIRYLLYGGQNGAQTIFFGGPDPNNPNNPSTIQHLYAIASPQPPELDISSITEERLLALETVLTTKFNQINQGQLVESSRLVTNTLRNLQGLLPAVVVSSSSLAFPPQPVGTTSASLAVTLTNLGGLLLNITSISLTPGFAQTNTCSGGVTGDQSCTISVTCTPSAVSPSNGTMTINVQGTTKVVALSCSGTDFALASSSPAASVSPGHPGTFPLSITPVGGFDQSIVFNCTWPNGQPQGTACSFTPSTPITPDGTHVAAAKVTIVTAATTASIFHSDRGQRTTGSRIGEWAQISYFGWPLALAILGALVMTRTRRLGLVGAIVILLSVMVACGGAGQGVKTQSGGTPPGTYTITIRASSGGLAHETNLTLTVN